MNKTLSKSDVLNNISKKGKTFKKFKEAIEKYAAENKIPQKTLKKLLDEAKNTYYSIKNNEVEIIVSKNKNGWSSTNIINEEYPELIFDPEIIKIIKDKYCDYDIKNKVFDEMKRIEESVRRKIRKYIREKYGVDNRIPRIPDLAVYKVKLGKLFRIVMHKRHDGTYAESLNYYMEKKWYHLSLHGDTKPKKRSSLEVIAAQNIINNISKKGKTFKKFKEAIEKYAVKNRVPQRSLRVLLEEAKNTYYSIKNNEVEIIVSQNFYAKEKEEWGWASKYIDVYPELIFDKNIINIIKEVYEGENYPSNEKLMSAQRIIQDYVYLEKHYKITVPLLFISEIPIETELFEIEKTDYEEIPLDFKEYSWYKIDS